MYKKTKSFICAFMAFLIVFTLHSYILTVGGESGYPSAELDNSTNFDFNYLENEILASRTVFDRTAKAVKSFEGQIKEVEQLRTANTKHFQMADGTFEAFAFLDDIHRRDASGKWQDIDNSLTPLDGKYTTEDGYVSFAEVYSEDCILTINSGDHTVSISPFGNAEKSYAIVTNPSNNELFKNNADEINVANISERANRETRVRYNSILDGIDVEYRLSNNDIKESIIINSFNGISSFECGIKMEGLTPRLEENVVILADQITGETVYIIPAPFMYDCEGNVSYDVFYKLTQEDSEFKLLIAADEQWLSSNERSFPIIIDPSINATTINKDSYVSHNNSTTNYGSAKYLRVQNDNNDQCYGLIHIDMPDVPTNATITSAYLYVTYFSVYTTLKSMNVNLYGINGSWSENGVTWNSASSSSFMDTSPSDTGTLSCSTYAYYRDQYINTSNIVKQWYAGRINRGIAIKYSSGTCKSLPIESKETNDTTMRPWYRILYTLDSLLIEEGDYLIENAELDGFLQIDDNDASNNYSSSNAILELFELDGYDYQKWHIKYLHNGCYSITSLRSLKAISVKNNQNYSLDVSLVQDIYTGDNRQQWVINSTSSGRYVIKANSSYGASYNLVMSVGGGTGVNGRNVIQGKYINNNSYLDEWHLYKVDGQQVMLLAISDTNGADRVSAYKKAFGYLSDYGFADFNFQYTDSISSNDCLDQMEDAMIFIIRGHGFSGPGNTCIQLDENSITDTLISSAICNNNVPAVDFSNMQLAIFAACKTAYLSSNNNLVDASVAAGSEHAIGFTDDVWPTEVNHWVELFLEARYSMGLSVAYACAYASNQETRLRLLVYYQ